MPLINLKLTEYSLQRWTLGYWCTLANYTEDLSPNTRQKLDLPPWNTTSRVTTMRPACSFSRTDSIKKPEACNIMCVVTWPWSSSLLKKTLTPPTKTASQELTSHSHQKPMPTQLTTLNFALKLLLHHIASTLSRTWPTPPSMPLNFQWCKSYHKWLHPHPTFMQWVNSNPLYSPICPVDILFTKWKIF